MWGRRVTRRAAIVYDCLYPLNHGGGERVYRRLAELLRERGYEVDYVTRRQWPDAEPPNVPFTLVPVWHGSIYDDNGSRTTSSAVLFARGVFGHLRAHRRDYDIVIASALPVLTLLAARLALVGSRTRLIGDWLEVWRWRQWCQYAGLFSGTIAWVLQGIGQRSAHGHTVNSSFTVERMSRSAGSPVVLGLVDLVDVVPVHEPATQPPYALFVGRHIPDKRITAIPAALALARRELPGLRAVIAGDGAETDALRRAIHAEQLDDAVDVVGRVDDATLAGLRAGAAVLLNPSAREGFGLVVAEAAALGVPSVVVAGPDNAAVDLVEPGVNGFVAESAEPAALADAILAAVRGGDGLRASTAAWFERERVTRSLSASVDEILRRFARN
jgi:glycosyltransferase involved in cell wall biosynthesis